MARQTLTIIAILGVAAGLCTAGVDLVSSYLWRSLPYPASDRLVTVSYPRENGPSILSLEAIDWTPVRSFAELTLSSDIDAFTILGGSAPFSADGRWMNADAFTMFGAAPAAGRFFTVEEAQRNEPLAVIGYRVWQEQFGGIHDAIGRTITARATLRQGRAETFTIIGVLPASFWHLDGRIGLVLPLSGSRPPSFMRLTAGMTPQEAARRLTAIARSQIADLRPDWSAVVQTARDAHVAAIRGMLTAALAAIGLLSLAALASLGFLQMARGMARQREFAVKTVLGQTYGRLLRDVIGEGARIGGGAALVALVTSTLLLWRGAPAVERYLGRTIAGGVGTLGTDPTLFLSSAAITMALGILLVTIGVAAARASTVTSALAGHPAFTDSRLRVAARQCVATAQVAVAFSLLLVAALMIRTAWHLSQLDLGFDPKGVLTATVTLHEDTYPSLEQRRQVFSRMVERLHQTPDIVAAGLTGWLPFRVGPAIWVEPEGAANAVSIRSTLRGVTPAYFQALRIPLLEGRLVSTDDRAGRPRVAVVSRSLARAAWADRSPLGQRFRMRFSSSDRSRPGFGPYTVIGVVQDTRQSLIDATPPEFYTAFEQEPLATNAFLHIRTRRDAAEIIPTVARVVRETDPTLPLDSAVPLESVIENAGMRPRFLGRVLSVFALIAVLVAITGLYAVSAWLARQRQREAALRVALGAPQKTVALLLARGGVAAIATGLAIGWATSGLLTSLIASELHGVAASDLTTRALVAVVLAAASLASLWGPAWRAARWNPSTLLRNE